MINTKTNPFSEDSCKFFLLFREHNVEHFRQGRDFIDFIDLNPKHIE